MEVPEIYDGIVKIVSAAREPGKRAKISSTAQIQTLILLAPV